MIAPEVVVRISISESETLSFGRPSLDYVERAHQAAFGAGEAQLGLGCQPSPRSASFYVPGLDHAAGKLSPPSLRAQSATENHLSRLPAGSFRADRPVRGSVSPSPREVSPCPFAPCSPYPARQQVGLGRRGTRHPIWCLAMPPNSPVGAHPR